MSSIPPNWLASGIQAQSAQQKTAETRDKDRAAAAQHVTESRFATHMQDVIEGAERDGDVNPDAEGSGSQGRADAGPPPDDTELPTDTPDDAKPGGSLDLRA